MRAVVAIPAAIGAVLVALLVWVIYGEVTEPDSGLVTGKKYHAPWTQMSCSGKPLVCTPIYHPECYEVRYADGDRDGDACVSEHEYDRYRIGDQFPGGES